MGKMRKEIIAGLAIIGLMLVIFGSLLYKRLRPAPDGEPEPVMAARDMAVPIREPEPHRTLVRAETMPDGELVSAEAREWAPAGSRTVAATEPVDAPPRESYLPREQANLSPDDVGTSPDSGAAPNDYGADPFARRRDPLEADAAGAGAANLQREVDQELRGQAERDALDVADAASPIDPAQARYDDDAPAEAVVTSGTYAAENELPRAGLRSRFPQEEMPRDNYDSFDHQPGQLRHEGGPGRMHTPVAVENGKYTVQPNDNYWKISQKVYGDGGYFKAIHEHNRLRYPRADKLQVGDVLDVPPASVLLERYADLCPKPRKAPPAHSTLQPASTRHRAGERVYVVGEGDTLFDIAKYELGKATRWAEIYELNRDVLGEEFDYLRPGTELVLPRGGRDDSITRGRDGGMQR